MFCMGHLFLNHCLGSSTSTWYRRGKENSQPEKKARLEKCRTGNLQSTTPPSITTVQSATVILAINFNYHGNVLSVPLQAGHHRTSSLTSCAHSTPFPKYSFNIFSSFSGPLDGTRSALTLSNISSPLHFYFEIVSH